MALLPLTSLWEKMEVMNILPKRKIPIWISVACLCGIFPPATTIFSAEAQNVRLVGYSDLQGRESLQLVLKGDFAYIGHHRGEKENPLTGKAEPNGTTIVDVSDPARPVVVKHIPGRRGAESRAVQVAENLRDGRNYLLRNQEAGDFTGFEIWDITDKGSPRIVSAIPLLAAHKSWWDPQSGYAYLSGTQPGWRGQHLIIYDLRDPLQPRFVSSWGLPGQRPGEREGGGVSLHHPVVSGNRAYLSYLFGGDVVVLDIGDKANPRMIAHLDFSPPHSGIHTTSPFDEIRPPDSPGRRGGVRNILVLSEEAFAYGCQELRRQLHIVDATVESKPVPIAVFKVPDGDFCERGGRFGPHQFAETRDGEIIGGNLLYVAYFNAGLRIVDISDPYRPREAGFYIPDPVGTRGSAGRRYVQTNDVDVDHRGLIYITDRDGHGMHILEYTGKR
jgi:hypothetical protein